jgi:hypothetical protein
MDNINIDCVGTIYMFTRDIQSCCNFEITNKMIYMASKFSKCKNHKQYLKLLLKYDKLMFNYRIDNFIQLSFGDYLLDVLTRVIKVFELSHGDYMLNVLTRVIEVYESRGTTIADYIMHAFNLCYSEDNNIIVKNNID